MADSPQSFADSMSGLLAATPFWVAPTRPAVLVNQFDDPATPVYAVGEPGKGGFVDAVKAALAAVNPWESTRTTSGAVAHATASVGKSATAALQAGAESLQSAGSGIKSGFRWAVMLLVFGLAAYAFMFASPFIPRPSGGR